MDNLDMDELNHLLRQIQLIASQVPSWTVPTYPTNPNGFSGYKRKLKELFYQAMVNDVIDGTSTLPEPPAARAADRAKVKLRRGIYQEKNTIIHYLITKSFGDDGPGYSHAGEIKDGDGVGVYKAINTHNERVLARANPTKAQFYTMKQSQDEDILSYALKLRDMAKIIPDVTEAEKKDVFRLGFIDPSDGHIRLVIHTMAMDPNVTFQRVLDVADESVIAYQKDKNLTKPACDTIAVRPRNQPQPKRFCHICKRTVQHTPEQCWFRQSEQLSKKSRTDDLVCYTCGEAGHAAPQCLSRAVPRPINSNRAFQARGYSGRRGRGSKRPMLNNPAARGSTWTARSTPRSDTGNKRTVNHIVPHVDALPYEEIEFNSCNAVIDPPPASILPSTFRFFLDSACFDHICKDREAFLTLSDSVHYLFVADKRRVDSKGQGQVAHFADVQYYPHMTANLLSEGRMIEDGYQFQQLPNGDKRASHPNDHIPDVYFRLQNRYWITEVHSSRDPEEDMLAKELTNHCLLNYSSELTNCTPHMPALSKQNLAFLMLHIKLAHVSYDTLYAALRRGTLTGFPYSWKHIQIRDLPACAIDKICKSTILPRSEKTSRLRANAIGQMFHSDLKGPIQSAGPKGERYWFTLIDDYSGYSWVYTLPKKSDALDLGLRRFVNEAARPNGILNFTLVHDNGGEYIGKDFTAYCAIEKIVCHPAPRKNKRFNGVAERGNRTFATKERCLRQYANLPDRTWPLSATFAVLMYNISPQGRDHLSPYYRWFQVHPDVSSLRVYGCECYMHNHEYSSSKGQNPGEVVRFVGYVQHSKSTYLVYRPRTGVVLASCDVTFIDHPVALSSPFQPQSEHVNADDNAPYNERESTRRVRPRHDLLNTGSGHLATNRNPSGLSSLSTRVSDEACADRDPRQTHPTLDDNVPHDTCVNVSQETSSPSTSVLHRSVPAVDNSNDAVLLPSVTTTSRLPIEGNRRLPAVAQTTDAVILPSSRSIGNSTRGLRTRSSPAVDNSTEAARLPQRRSTRERKPVDRLLYMLAMCTGDEETHLMTTIGTIDDVQYPSHSDLCFAVFDEPQSYAGVIRSPDQARWIAAMNEELEGLTNQGTWTVVDIPPHVNLMKTKWIFKKKRDKNGNVDRYRARLVVKGYTQIYGLDYNQTFSPVVRHSTLRIVLALSAHYGLYTRQLDVPKAFPQSDIDFDCYMLPPVGTTLPKGKCYKLLKSLYGLKQASRLFFRMISSFLIDNGFTQCASDTCLYYLAKDTQIVLLCTYVDDILLAASSPELCTHYSDLLRHRFQTNDLGSVEWFLGIRIYTSADRHTIQLSQSQYVNTILDATHTQREQNSPVPMHPDCKLTKDMSPTTSADIEFMADKPYRKAVGMLMYLMVCSRPDIAYAVCSCARFLENPGKEHWKAVVQIMKYLKGTINFRIQYKKSTTVLPVLHGYSDANWASQDLDNRRSHSGFVFMLCGGPIAWKATLQTSLALSSMDAEYYAMGDSAKEAVALKSVTDELHKTTSDSSSAQPISISVDNTSAIQLSADPVFHRRSKHIELRHHFIRQLVADEIVKFEYISTDSNVADIFTKPLHKISFRKHRTVLAGNVTDVLS